MGYPSHVPADRDTSSPVPVPWGWSKPPNPQQHKDRRDRTPYPSKDYHYPQFPYPAYSPPIPPWASYPPQHNPPVPVWGSGSVYPTPPPSILGPPQPPYWQQNGWPGWPQSSSVIPYAYYPPQPPVPIPPASPVIPYPQPPTQPTQPPAPAFQNHPAYPNQQPALTLYINPALLTPAVPSYNPQPSFQYPHVAPPNAWGLADQQSPVIPPWREPETGGKRKAGQVRFAGDVNVIHPSPSSPHKPTFPISKPPPIRPSSPDHAPISYGMLTSPERPSPRIPLPPPHELAPDPVPPSPSSSVSSLSLQFPSPVPPSSPPSFSRGDKPPPSIKPITGGLTHPTQLKPLSPSSMPSLPGFFSQYPEPPLAQTIAKPTLQGIADVHGQSSDPAPPPTRAVVSQTRLNEIRGKIVQQYVSKKKLEQALKVSDPKLKAFEEFVDLPKLLEIFGLTADQNITATENSVAQASDSAERSKSVPWEIIILPNNSSSQKETPEEEIKNGVEPSLHETNAENTIPEIPPSPLEYNINLTSVDSDSDDGDYDNDVDTNSQNGHSTGEGSGGKSDDENHEVQT